MTSQDEDVPSEDVAMLRQVLALADSTYPNPNLNPNPNPNPNANANPNPNQVFALADSTGDGFINETELGQMHQVLGEPLSEAEVRAALLTRTRTLARTLTNANPHPHPEPHFNP